MTSRTIIITGGTSGLGYQCALKLAGQHPDVNIIIASRTDINQAAASINAKTGLTNVSYMPLDLCSLAAIRAFASSYAQQQHAPISALVLNAGLQFLETEIYSADGIETTFAANHVGHALLFYLLRSHLADNARIVLTSSGGHDPAQKTGMPDAEYTSGEALAHPPISKPGQQRYTTSKLCNVLWMYALVRHIKSADKHWTVTAMDPGLMPGTGLARDFPVLLRWLWISILPHILPLVRIIVGFSNVKTTAESGASLARLAVAKEVEGITAVYFEGAKEIKSSVESYDEVKQEELWEWTEKFVTKDEEELKSFKTL